MYCTLPVLIFRRNQKWQRTWHLWLGVGTKIQPPQQRMGKTIILILLPYPKPQLKSVQVYLRAINDMS